MSRDREPAARRRPRRSGEAAALLAAAIVFGCVCSLPLELAAHAGIAGAPPGWLLPLDDAYIFVRYAQQAARGLPWQWNTGEPSSGASSALWPWLLVPAQWLSHDLAVWSRWSRWIGVASLWALGLAGARALRAARLREPWPLAGGLCLVWSGPVGFGAIAGMESAGNAALVVMACALWMECAGTRAGPSPARSTLVWALVAAAALPLARPENGALTLLAAVALLAGKDLPWRRWTGLAVLAPGMLLAWCNWLATDHFLPAGALAKSWLHVPFLPFGARVASYWTVLRRDLLPVYLGTNPTGLWPPVGLLAAATAVAALAAAIVRSRSAKRGGAGGDPRGAEARLARLAPLAVVWMILVALAPLSIMLLWQEMRHHHAGLVLAWLLALAGIALGGEALAAWLRGWRERREGQPRTVAALPAVRWQAAPLALPLLLVAAFPHWARESARGAVQLYRGHERAAAWLAVNAHREVLLVTDAGWLALVHDGPVIDGLGLCSPDLTEPALHGPGALAESLARRPVLPSIAAAEPALLKLPIFGKSLLPGPPPAGEITVLARVRQELLAGAKPGARELNAAIPAQDQLLDILDFAYLPDERRHRLRWQPPPLPPHTSAALLIPDPEAGTAGSGPSLQGCRPLFGSLEVGLPAGTATVRLRAAALAPSAEAEVVASLGGEAGEIAGKGAAAAGDPASERGAARPAFVGGLLAADHWSELAMTLPAPGASALRLARLGPGVPCLESLLFFGRAPAEPGGSIR